MTNETELPAHLKTAFEHFEAEERDRRVRAFLEEERATLLRQLEEHDAKDRIERERDKARTAGPRRELADATTALRVAERRHEKALLACSRVDELAHNGAHGRATRRPPRFLTRNRSASDGVPS